MPKRCMDNDIVGALEYIEQHYADPDQVQLTFPEEKRNLIYIFLESMENTFAEPEAGGNISKIVETAALVGDKLDIYSGNDDQIIPVLSVGGSGVISVASV